MATIMSETFYHVPPPPSGEEGAEGGREGGGGGDRAEREYLQERIKGHALWRSRHFWEEASVICTQLLKLELGLGEAAREEKRRARRCETLTQPL